MSDSKLLSPEVLHDPYGFYATIRHQCPVTQLPGSDFFVVSRYDDIKYVLEEPETFSASNSTRGLRRDTPEIRGILKETYPQAQMLVTADPPLHTRQRRLVNKFFYPRVNKLKAKIRSACNELIDAFVTGGTVEFVRQFADPLPVFTISDLMGLPRADLPKLKRWADELAMILGGLLSYAQELDLVRSSLERDRYFADKIEERREQPKDDLISDLVNARQDGELVFTTEQLINGLLVLFAAGHQTSIAMLTNAMMLLVHHPDQLQAIYADPSLIPNFVEESLRFEPPLQGHFRLATADTEVNGVRIPKGSHILLLFASGNRDETVFSDPAYFDIRRPDAKAHLSFGAGIHFCIGAPLARLEGRLAFETLLSRLNNLRLAEERNDFRLLPSFILRRVEELHLEFDPA